MSMEKRFLVFLLLSLALMVGSQALVAVLWPKKPRPAADPAIAALEEAEKTKAQAADLRAGDEKAKSGEEESPASDTPAPKAAIADSNTPPRTEVPEPAIIAGEELILGSLEDASGTGYRLRASLSQEGAGVGRIESAIYKAESPTNRRPTEPLELIQPNPLEAPSFATVIPYDAAGTLRRSTQSHDGKALHELVDASEAVQAYVVLPPQWDLSRLLDRRVGVRGTSSSVEGLSARLITDIRRMDWLDQDGLDRRPWEVVRDDAGRIVRPVIVEGRETGQEVVFRTTIDDPAVTIAKRFRLLMGSDALEMSLSFASAPGAKAAQAISYQIFGPHRVPIEGEWYTGTFRDVFIAQADGAGTKIETRSAADVAKAAGAPERFQALPLLFAGVENQYFAVFLRPEDVPEDPAARWDAETVPTVVEVDPQQPHKADVTVTILSKPVVLEPGAERTFTYSIYAGPKTAANLSLFAAEDLASYRKGWQIPILGPLGASLARGVIAPLLGQIYKFTESVARVFGGTRGNYGVAIILLTVLVRLLLFPLSRKQAIMAKKMQEIQPLLNELKEKHKDDKEKFAR
jgi:YidC/Oxa1 family membrane protein insertase